MFKNDIYTVAYMQNKPDMDMTHIAFSNHYRNSYV